MPIIISQDGKNAQKINPSSFDREDYLQQYIYDNPDVIPLYEIDDTIRLLVLAREFPTKSGPIDALGIDQQGNIYVIETKLYRNPDKRTVVAQVLDYGASLWKHGHDITEFTSVLEKAAQKQFNLSYGDKIKDFFGISADEFTALWNVVTMNLNEGNLKFVVMMDSLHSQLKDLIIFLNQNSKFDIYAVELEYYNHKEYEIMIPKLFGGEVKKDVRSSTKSARGQWDEARFLETARQSLDAGHFTGVQKLYEFIKKHADHVYWGVGVATGSCNPIFESIHAEYPPFSLKSDGKLALNFGYFKNNEKDITFRDAFKSDIEAALQWQIPKDYEGRYLNVEAGIWADKADSLIDAVRKYLA